MRLTIRQMLGGKKIWLLALFLALPILLTLAVLASDGFANDIDDDEVAYALLLYLLYPQVLCILASLIYGASLLAGEIEDKTLVYLFTRRQARWRVLLGKYLTTALVLACMTTISMTISFLLAGAPEGFQLWKALSATTFAACFAYTAIFALLGIALPKRAITIGLIYAVLVEFVLSLVPALVNEVTASYYLRSMAFHIADLPLPDEVVAIVGNASQTTSLVAVIVIPALALLVSACVIHRREWPLTEGV
ncbi:MAG: ABC-type transport system involved in multi-copper enzyme maturation permease subunit [Planctomycetota bacterium]|jgi:ABC-type transport system involved in multi-copper enzyme maturation permease subunit